MLITAQVLFTLPADGSIAQACALLASALIYVFMRVQLEAACRESTCRSPCAYAPLHHPPLAEHTQAKKPDGGAKELILDLPQRGSTGSAASTNTSTSQIAQGIEDAHEVS